MTRRTQAEMKVDAPVKKIDADSSIIRAAKARRKKVESKRKKLGALPGQKLFAEKIPGYNLRWVNGTAERLDTLLNKGYSLVSNSRKDDCTLTTDLGSTKSQIVGTAKSGEPERHYLMAIPEEIYREDQITKEQVVIDRSAAVSRNERDTRKLATPAGKAELYEP